jgi:hypothetical protein
VVGAATPGYGYASLGPIDYIDPTGQNPVVVIGLACPGCVLGVIVVAGVAITVVVCMDYWRRNPRVRQCQRECQDICLFDVDGGVEYWQCYLTCLPQCLANGGPPN